MWCLIGLLCLALRVGELVWLLLRIVGAVPELCSWVAKIRVSRLASCPWNPLQSIADQNDGDEGGKGEGWTA